MKKPEITEGEWKVEEYTDGSMGISCNNHMIAEINDAFREITPNAQAISAVPEMIDALVEVFEELVEEGIEDELPFSKVKQSLKKAGCKEWP